MERILHQWMLLLEDRAENEMIRMFFSLRATTVLLLVLAGVLGSITAFEAADTTAGQYHGTYRMYGSWWFALLLGLVFLNLLGGLLTRRMRRRLTNLCLHIGLGLLLGGAFFSWRSAERGMVYLFEGQETNLLESNDRLWIERETSDGELTQVELRRSNDLDVNSNRRLDAGAGETRLLAFLPHARVTDTARSLPEGSGGPAALFNIGTAQGGHELLLAGGFQEEADVAGLRIILAPPGVSAAQQSILLIRTATEEARLPVNLPDDVGRRFHVLAFDLQILEYTPEFRVGRPVDLSRPTTNPSLLLRIGTAAGMVDTIRLFSRFPGFSKPRVPELTNISFTVPSRANSRLHVYPDSLKTWRFAFVGTGDPVTGTVAMGDTFFVGQGARLPLAVEKLLIDAEVVPQVAPSSEGPAAVRLALESVDEPVWLIEDGPDVVVPTGDGGTVTMRLVATAPLPFWIRLDEATRTFYPNSSIPRLYASSIRVGLTPDGYDTSQTVETSKPLTYHGWRIYQSEYGERDWRSYSGLQLAKDPGAPLAGAGVLMLLAGILVRAGKKS